MGRCAPGRSLLRRVLSGGRAAANRQRDRFAKNHELVIHNTVIIAQFFRRQGLLNMTTEVQLPGSITSLPRECTDEDMTRFFDACDSLENALFRAFSSRACGNRRWCLT